VLKNSFALISVPGSEAENGVLVFGLVSGLFWSADRADIDSFNRLVSSANCSCLKISVLQTQDRIGESDEFEDH
jgi:hypothetical protein